MKLPRYMKSGKDGKTIIVKWWGVLYLKLRYVFLSIVIARLFPHRHKWQQRGVNKYGATTYRMCLKCRETQQRVNKSNEPDRFEKCKPIIDLDAQFDENDEYIFEHY